MLEGAIDPKTKFWLCISSRHKMMGSKVLRIYSSLKAIILLALLLTYNSFSRVDFSLGYKKPLLYLIERSSEGWEIWLYNGMQLLL